MLVRPIHDFEQEYVPLASRALVDYLDEEDEERSIGKPKDVIHTTSLVAILTDTGIGLCYVKSIQRKL